MVAVGLDVCVVILFIHLDEHIIMPYLFYLTHLCLFCNFQLYRLSNQ
jgi:hypothetical protein